MDRSGTIATFHEADIQVEAILSYPWMEEARVGVFPHLEALARYSSWAGVACFSWTAGLGRRT